ncbi:MAG: bifunctional diaminohydroxyphosphoribosylaminopyrimidine deaminase/5-amino-6-(5-phosphoribosylamino)uracil reductase RibD [Betaproteobacteria bacterium]|nr:bifunctional diaminohydroxyphosphoribosylaminopyrimidine deaminase/5-amino-6-(5-phosphoribosylamino)uracil reductase RibD [Betaproteobacteria bacterium]
MPPLESDTYWMSHALSWAEKALFITSPNPRVGCVIINAQGVLLGAGHTQPAGQAHAEIMALQDAKQRGMDVAGAIAYVSLEPCSHQGRTGPCCEALIQAGLSRVVVAVQDPNPQVSGSGITRLRQSGMQVDVGILQDEARALNQGFFKRMTTGLPWMRLKVAASLDGQTALSNGVSQWITSAAARQDGHAWRARACALLTGIGTVLEDDPQLNVRDIDSPRQPTLVIVDSKLETPLNAKLWQTQREVWIYCAIEAADRRAALEAKGARVVCLPNALGKVDLHAMQQDLGQRSINELHIEAGFKLNGSLLGDGLVDELLVYLAPMLIGNGLGIANLGPFASLSQALKLDIQNVASVGDDIRVIAHMKNQ